MPITQSGFAAQNPQPSRWRTMLAYATPIALVIDGAILGVLLTLLLDDSIWDLEVFLKQKFPQFSDIFVVVARNDVWILMLACVAVLVAFYVLRAYRPFRMRARWASWYVGVLWVVALVLIALSIFAFSKMSRGGCVLPPPPGLPATPPLTGCGPAWPF